MFGEFLREAAVLVAVFIPLDVVMTTKSLTFAHLLSTLALSGTLLVVGMYLETSRSD